MILSTLNAYWTGFPSIPLNADEFMLENICMHGMTLHVRRFKEIKVQCRALQKLAAFWH